MKKTLVIFAHPYLEYASNNEELTKYYENCDSFVFRDIYEEYPDFHIAAFKERKRIHQFDRFIFHFPIIWFGMPPLLRLWVDEVLENKWLNKEEKNPLENKEIFFFITTRGKERSYRRDGKYYYSVDELISGLIVSLKIFRAQIKYIYTVFDSENLTKKEIDLHKQKFAEILKK
ncbi:MAG: NAD(P)H-dependent oxidoreductase [Bergeyella sp.]|nr:NAD(P)H-dependent oxidoreductase [Bergeyella sp.]